MRARVFFELIGWDPAAVDRVLDGAHARLGSLNLPDTVTVSLAAHAPHSVSPELLTAIVEAGGIASLHLAESPHESRFLDGGDAQWSAFLARRGLGHVAFRAPRIEPRPLRSTRLGVLRPGLLAVHAVQVDAADRALLAARGVVVVLCPRSNEALDVGRAPVPELREAGVRLCLGTDSLASVPSLDLWDDVLALHRAFPVARAGVARGQRDPRAARRPSASTISAASRPERRPPSRSRTGRPPCPSPSRSSSPARHGCAVSGHEGARGACPRVRADDQVLALRIRPAFRAGLGGGGGGGPGARGASCRGSWWP